MSILTTSICFSPLFVGLIFILAMLPVILCVEITLGENVPILYWQYHQHSLLFLDQNSCTCCVDTQYMNEGLHSCDLIPYKYFPNLPDELICMANCEENLGYDFPISAANYIGQSLNPIESNTCQCCTKVSG
ncbi:hypothetical protein MKX01_021404 [Papaver californicum]|nr:hypothetical protein MKX01_021404 [Papaver californicum]